mmetsp:Transcript_3289/g.7283  ORF Transcript_3289/g.7283 Transcript_3289/m.7283 type:complete len:127 (-) Transcript_3289:76-456(-)
MWIDARSPSLMVRMAASHPRIIVPSPTTIRCLSEREKETSDPSALQKYFTTTLSPARTTRPVPSTVVVFEIPSVSVLAGVEKRQVAVPRRAFAVRPPDGWENASVELQERNAAKSGRTLEETMVAG